MKIKTRYFLVINIETIDRADNALLRYCYLKMVESVIYHFHPNIYTHNMMKKDDLMKIRFGL